MFSIFSQRQYLLKSNLFDDFTDYHSHILPCVDDGIRSVESALEVLTYYESLGIKRVIFTPHIMESFPENNAEYLRSEFSKFKSIYQGGIELNLAAEYMLDSGFEEHLQSGDMLTLRDNHLLVETSYVSPPINLRETLEAIKTNGYFVVLAHPERYLYLRKEEYRELKGMGVMFQFNFPSLLGVYGKSVQERAKWLLEASYYDLVGSDVHNFKHFSNTLSRGRLSKSHIGLIKNINNKNWSQL